jgi:putative ABC transport system permease protein
MPTLLGLGQWLRAILFRNRVEQELDEELRDHVERERQRQLAEGADPREAARQTALRVGNLEAAKEAVRDERGGRIVSDAVADLRIGLRSLRRTPGFALAVVLSLGLGVGGVTAISSVVHAVVLRSMPYADADRLHLVRVWWGSFSATLSPLDYEILRERSAPVGPVGAYFFPDDGFTMMTPAGPDVVQGVFLTAELPQVLGVAPILGPGYSTNPNADEVLIGTELWNRQFGGRPDVIGRVIRFDARDETVVGVMPPGFDVPGSHGSQAWIKGRWRPPTRRGPFYFLTIIRLREGLSPEAAARQLTELAAPIMRERDNGNAKWGYGVRSVLDAVVSDSRKTLTLAFAAVVLVLVIAILNVANLMLARGTVRVRELAVRASLGAGRGRLIRQVLAEAALLGALGGALGLGLATLIITAFHDVALTLVPRMQEVRIDAATAMFALATGIGAALVAAMVPVFRTRWNDLADSMRDAGRTASTGPRQAVVRRVLVALELAIALTVLMGAALLAKTLHRLESTDPGFQPSDLVSFRLVLPQESYNEERRRAFFTELERRLGALSEGQSVAFSGALPPDNLPFTNNLTVERSSTDRGVVVAEVVEASERFFATLDIPIRRGRAFDATDRRGGAPVAIVNEKFAHKQFQTIDVLGRRFKNGNPDSDSPWVTIVGVAGDVPYGGGVWGGADQTVYFPLAQTMWSDAPYIVVRLDPSSGAGSLEAIRSAIRTLDPALPLRDVATMQERLHRSTSIPRFRSWLAICFAGIALALAVTGIYGVMAYHVSQHRRETAIRRALGAREGQIARDVLASGLKLAGAGIAAGAVGALAASNSFSSVLYHVDGRDPALLAAAIAVLAGAAILACVIPAGRAGRVDPMLILRDE